MISAIIVMAGSGKRMMLKENKVYLPLGNKKIFQYSVDLFIKQSFEVVCVIREEDRPLLKAYEGKVKIVYGGATRQESVYNGLKASTGEYVLIHDAARPFLTLQIIQKCLEAFASNQACLVVHPCKESVYQVKPFIDVNRDSLVLAQTPQGAKRSKLLEAHEKAIVDNFTATDDISLLIKYTDEIVKLIDGDENNFKVTTMLDYITAKELIKND